ncbi:hypothetical protein L1987_17549 [Smallanthus sonchifolius]|uniref:Uncharacterized protein n=1 Tax=Smallanthus sonchifolius TaxID=185202 RepID=A0ACB9IYB8_9ASTR|nr:hypothetical protein L1987_17549 [Smallanthus sonchifolius]
MYSSIFLGSYLVSRSLPIEFCLFLSVIPLMLRGLLPLTTIEDDDDCGKWSQSCVKWNICSRNDSDRGCYDFWKNVLVEWQFMVLAN